MDMTFNALSAELFLFKREETSLREGEARPTLARKRADVNLIFAGPKTPGLDLDQEGVCVFRSMRPPIPTTCAHLFRDIRPPVTRCREAACFRYQV